MNFDIKTEQLSEDAYVISLAGEVDLYTAPEFKQQLLEVVAQGEEATLATYIDRLRKGSLLSRVEQVEVEWREPTNHLTSFTILF